MDSNEGSAKSVVLVYPKIRLFKGCDIMFILVISSTLKHTMEWHQIFHLNDSIFERQYL